MLSPSCSDEPSQTVTHHRIQCQGCGATLPSADAICPSCETELTAQPPSPPAKYICPHCHERFAAAISAPWPPKVPWWRPTTMRLQCPVCHEPVRDRHAVQPPGWLMGMAVVSIICLHWFTAGWGRLLLAIPLLSLYAPLIWSAWKVSRDVDNPHRFVAGSATFWHRGDDQLQRAVDRVRTEHSEPHR